MEIHPYLSNKSLKKLKIVHMAKDKKPFPYPIGWAICKNGHNKPHKTKSFRTACEKYWHLIYIHKNNNLDSPTQKEELVNLEQLSIANQRGILIK